MKTIKMVTIAFVITASSLASAVVRVLPRTEDYGQPTEHRLDRITDRFSLAGLAATMRGQHLGGDSDIVFSSAVSDLDGSEQIAISTCPSVKLCQGKESTCLADRKFWHCQQIFQGSPAETCRKYHDSRVLNDIFVFVKGQVIGGILTAPFDFFQHGIGYIATQISTANDGILTFKKVQHESCDSMPTSLSGSELSSSAVHVKVEAMKLQVQFLIGTFSPNSPVEPNSGSAEVENTEPKSVFPRNIEISVPTN